MNTEPKASDALRGPWVALLTDQYGDPMTVEDFEDDDNGFPEIAVVRGSAAPQSSGHRRPGSYLVDDV